MVQLSNDPRLREEVLAVPPDADAAPDWRLLLLLEQGAAWRAETLTGVLPQEPATRPSAALAPSRR